MRSRCPTAKRLSLAPIPIALIVVADPAMAQTTIPALQLSPDITTASDS